MFKAPFKHIETYILKPNLSYLDVSWTLFHVVSRWANSWVSPSCGAKMMRVPWQSRKIRTKRVENADWIFFYRDFVVCNFHHHQQYIYIYTYTIIYTYTYILYIHDILYISLTQQYIYIYMYVILWWLNEIYWDRARIIGDGILGHPLRMFIWLIV